MAGMIMKIGIDLDEVIVEQLDELVKFYYAKTGKLIPKEKFHSYYWHDVWKIPLEDAIAIDYEFKKSEQFEKIKPVEKAVESINKLAKMSELFIITSRPIIFKEKTEAWVKKHFGELPIKLIHSGDFHDYNKTKKKFEICKEFGIKIIIEDQDKYAIECANEGIKVILFDKPWNKKVSHNNIKRVKNWEETLIEIRKMYTNLNP